MIAETVPLLGSAASGAVNGWLCVMVAGTGWMSLRSQTLKSVGFVIALVGGSAVFALHFGGFASAIAEILTAGASVFARLAINREFARST